MEQNLIKILEDIQLNDTIDKQKEFDNVLELIESNIKHLFNQIKKSQDIYDAKDFFRPLAKIQFVLANLLFVQDLSLPDKLKVFVHDFERLDDIDLIKYLYEKIKNDEYHL